MYKEVFGGREYRDMVSFVPSPTTTLRDTYETPMEAALYVDDQRQSHR